MNKSSRKVNNNKKNATAPVVSQKFLLYIRRILLGLLMILVFYPPYLRGLYFEAEQLPSEIFTLSIFILFWIYKYFKQDSKFLKTPIDYSAFGVTVIYLVSIFVAVSTRSAITEWLKYFMYFAIYYMITDLCVTEKSRLLIIWTAVAAAVGVCIIGIDAAAGGVFTTFLNNIFQALGADHNIFFGLFVEGRINSTIQYPNALAAYVLAVYILTIGLITASKSIITKIAGSIFSFILMLTFILTYSRGAYILLPIILIIFTILLPKGFKIGGIANIVASISTSALIYLLLSNLLSNPTDNILKIWLCIVAGIIISSVLCVIIEGIIKWLQKISWHVYLTLCCTIIVILLAGSIYIYNSSSPVELVNEMGQKDSYKSFIKEISLEPGKDYKLQIDVKSDSEIKDKPWNYQIIVRNINKKNIIFGGNTQLGILEEKEANVNGTKELDFNVPSDSKTVQIVLGNYGDGSKVTYDNLRIVDLGKTQDTKKVILKHKYIPDSIVNKFENMFVSNSSISRNIFYEDGIKIFKDHWLLGAGGGAWQIIYFQYQSYLYYTTQAHNYFLQLGIETGIIGLIVLLALIISLIYFGIKHYASKNNMDNKKAIVATSLFAAISAMIMHSVIDFDLSLSAIYLLLWQLIALVNSYDEEQKEVLESNTVLEKFVSKINSSFKLPAFNIHPILALVITIVIIILPIKFNVGLNYGSNATKALQAQDLNGALDNYKKAISADNIADSFKVDYGYYLVQQDPKKIPQKDLQTAANYMKEAEKSINSMPDLAAEAGSFYLKCGELAKGLSLFDRAVELRPLLPQQWLEKASAYYQVAMYYNSIGDKQNFDKYLSIISDLPKEAKEKNSRNIGDFLFDSNTSRIIEKAYYAKNYNSGVPDEKLVFLSMNSMDVNDDKIPDQWMDSNSYEVLQNNNGNLKVKSKPNIISNIVSRSLEYKAGKTYKIEVKLSDSSKLEEMKYILNESDKTPKDFTKNGNIYISSFTADNSLSNDKNKLKLQIYGECEIEYIKITEK